MRKIISPAVVLFFLSPALAELLSGSAPPAEFFDPFALAVLPALYGSGAILARELTFRWGKGWPTLLALGAAYGIVEEGLMVKSFFDPNWMDLGMLGSYGRWAGVNWVWSVELTLFHAIFSVALPILLVELIFPARRDSSWVGRRGMLGFSTLLTCVVVFGFLALTSYRPPAMPYLLALLASVSLVLLARRLPRQPFASHGRLPPRSLWFGLAGFAATLAFFLVFWALPETPLAPLATILIGLGLAAMVAWVVLRMSDGGTAWADIHRLALAAGALGFFIAISPLHELDTSRVDNPSGMTWVGLATLLFLVWLRRRVRNAALTPAGRPPHREDAWT